MAPNASQMSSFAGTLTLLLLVAAFALCSLTLITLQINRLTRSLPYLARHTHASLSTVNDTRYSEISRQSDVHSSHELQRNLGEKMNQAKCEAQDIKLRLAQSGNSAIVVTGNITHGQNALAALDIIVAPRQAECPLKQIPTLENELFLHWDKTSRNSETTDDVTHDVTTWTLRQLANPRFSLGFTDPMTSVDLNERTLQVIVSPASPNNRLAALCCVVELLDL